MTERMTRKLTETTGPWDLQGRDPAPCGPAPPPVPGPGMHGGSRLGVIDVILVLLGLVYWWNGRNGLDHREGGDTGTVPWTFDYEKGLEMAEQTGRPSMVFFTASWCGYCKKMIRGAFSDPAVTRASGRVVPVFVDVDKRQDLMDAFDIRGVPAVYFLAPDGEILHRLVGERDAKAILTMIQQVAPDT